MVKIIRDSNGNYKYFVYKKDQNFSNENEAILMGEDFTSPDEALKILADFASGILHRTIQIKDIIYTLEP